MNVELINVTRLGEWEEILTSKNSTAVILIGIGHGGKSGELQLCTVKDVSAEDIKILLEKTIKLLNTAKTFDY